MKTCVISGGTRGIGLECVKMFASNGYNVAFLYKNSEEAALDAAKKYGAFPIKADISDSESVKTAVTEVKSHFGHADVLVNNAGISHIGLFQDMDDSIWRKVLDTNLSGAFYLCRELVPDMIKNGYGRIINIGSVWGKHGASCEVAYSASKAGLRGLTASLAKELGPSGITVNCVEPGVIETDMNAHLDSESLKELIDATPLMRLGKAEEVAQAVMFLASDNASFITGQFIGVDGGFPY